MRVVRQIAKKTAFGISDRHENNLTSVVGVNTIVTSLHIILIIGFTILTFGEELIYPQLGPSTAQRVSIVFYFATGALDIFVSYIIWFMLDETNMQTLMLLDEQSNQLYPMIDVIDTVASSGRPLSGS